jgi:hypothetical protein
MKQGRVTTTGNDSKVEPSPHAKNPGYVSYLGNKLGNHATDSGDFAPNFTPETSGRGYKAPGIGASSHKSGSQGKH